MNEVAENTILVSEKAKAKITQLMQEADIANDSAYFLRVGVVGGGCSGLSYKLDFDNEVKPMDQVFEDKGIRIVTDLKSFLYLVNTELDFFDANGFILFKNFISKDQVALFLSEAQRVESELIASGTTVINGTPLK